MTQLLASLRPTVRRDVVRWGVLLGVVALILIAQADVVTGLVTTSGGRTVALQGLLTGLLLGGVYGLVAMGLSLIFGVLEIINFAHGAFLTLAMYVTFSLVSQFGVNPYLTLLVTPPVMLLVGGAVQRWVINPAMGQPLENQLLLTFGISILIENALLLAFTATPKSVGFSGVRSLFGVGFPLRVGGAVLELPRIVAFVAGLAFAGALWLFLRRTKLGTAVRAVGQNPTGASLVGIDVKRVYVLTFGIGTAVAAAAGVLILPFLTLEPTTGAQFNILSFVIVVLAGLGNVPGAVAGGILIGLTQELGGLLFPGQSKLLPVFAIFVLTLFLKPEGLFGSTRQ
jgi:branched-chain amino acid transport system permease protein